MDDPTKAIIAISLFASLAYSVKTIASAVVQSRLNERRPERDLGTNEQRLARIEQAVDSIAVEVERISEGQRFTTKLLSDRARNTERASG